MESATTAVNEKESMVDPFLVEALQNPRHRLTILRMELDIQRFLRNSDQQQFEFQHFPTSYLRLAAHRVAQHYGLVTMVQDIGSDGLGNTILVRKTPESRYPAVHLSEIPAKQSENDKPEHVKIVTRPRLYKRSASEANGAEKKQNSMRSIEERKEEYDRARARIFNSASGSDSDDSSSQAPTEVKNTSLSRDENDAPKSTPADAQKSISLRESGNSSRVAIFRDREKDRFDPDYDRSYERYVRSLPTNRSFSLPTFNMQNIQPPYYETAFPQYGQIPGTQTSLSYGPPASPVMNSFTSGGVNQMSGDAAYMHWPSAAMMYANSYDHFRHAALQAQYCQQPLSFNYSPNH